MARRRRRCQRGRLFQMRYSRNSVYGSLVAIVAQAPTQWVPDSVMVRVLAADDAVKLFRAIVLQRGLARQVYDGHHPAEPRFGAKLLGRHQPGPPAEGAGPDRDS